MIEEVDSRALMQMTACFEDAGRIGQQLIDDQIELVEIDTGGMAQHVEKAGIHCRILLDRCLFYETVDFVSGNHS